MSKLGSYGQIERNITRNEDEFLIKGNFAIPQKGIPFIKFDPDTTIRSEKIFANKGFNTYDHPVNFKFTRNNKSFDPWIVNYWTSKLSTDSFELKNLVAPTPEN